MRKYALGLEHYFRERNPELPYIMIPRSDYWTSTCTQSEVLTASCLKVRQAG